MGHRKTRQAFTLVQLVIAVIAMAVVLRVTLEFGAPAKRSGHGPKYIAMQKQMTKKIPMKDIDGEPLEAKPLGMFYDIQVQSEPVIESSQANESGTSAIIRILRQYRPSISNETIDELVDTLPPGGEQRIIVILPTSYEWLASDEAKCKTGEPRED